MSRKIINLFIFLIMMFSLTAMPINMSALQFDFSWQKYHQVEKQKVEQETQATIAETSKDQAYHLTSEVPSFLSNPKTISLKLTGDDQLKTLSKDVFDKLEVVVKIGGVDYKTFKGADLKGLTVKEASGFMDATLDLTTFNLPEGQYDLSIHSTSELTASNPAIETKIAYYANDNYTAALTSKPSGQVVTFYYPSTDGQLLIPFTQKVSGSKVLRAIANTYYKGASEALPVMQGQLTPRISTIQLKSGLLTLSISDAEAKKYMETHATGKMAIEGMLQSFYSIDYINDAEIIVNKEKVGIVFNDLNLETIPSKSTTTKIYRSYQLPDSRLILIPREYQGVMNDYQGMFNALKTGETIGTAVLQPIVPYNVEFGGIAANDNQLTLDLKTTGDLFGGSQKLTQRMIDGIVLSYLNQTSYTTLTITLNGQPSQIVNGIDLTQPFKLPLYINPVE